MGNSIWEQFQLSPGDPEQINILGVDAGDGENCFSRAEHLGKIQTSSHPYLDNSHQTDKQITAYYRSQNGTVEVVGMEALQYDSAEGPPTYVNFKRPLDGDLAGQKYEGLFDDSILTYQEIMQRNFQCLVQKVFECNPSLCNKPRTVLFVGRPASEIWEKCEQDYQKLLKGGLFIPDYNGKIDVVVYSEAQAALAYEYKEGHIRPGETVVIIDGGSSTFDAVVVRNGKIIGEYSRQVGAGMIEDNMLDLFLAWKPGDDQLLRSVDTRRDMREQNSVDVKQDLSLSKLKLQLREKKEEYFGSDGHNGTEDNAYSIFINGQKHRKFIDHSLMQQAIYEVPIRVKESYLQKNQLNYHEQDYPSFAVAVRAFFEGVYLVCKQANAMPQQVILTGGATVMPFIQELAEAAFQLPPTRADFPSFSVAEGLAFMGYVEFLKRQVLDDVKSNVHMLIDNAVPHIAYAVQNAYVDAVWKDKFEQGLDTWVNTTDFGDTLTDWMELCNVYIPSGPVQAKVQAQLEQDNLYSQIKQYLDDKFFSLFPNLKSEYYYSIPVNLVASILGDVPNLNNYTLSLSNLLGFMQFLFGINWDTPLTAEQRAAKAAVIKERKHKIQENLGKQFGSHSYQAAKDIAAAMCTQMDCNLEDYVEGMTPYFVQYR